MPQKVKKYNIETDSIQRILYSLETIRYKIFLTLFFTLSIGIYFFRTVLVLANKDFTNKTNQPGLF